MADFGKLNFAVAFVPQTAFPLDGRTYFESLEAAQAAAGKAHEHANKAELDKIETGDKEKWDAAEQNAKDYADELNTAMGKRMTAAEGKLTTLQGDEKTEGSVKKALADAKGYADGLNSNMDTRVKAVEEAVTVGTF